MPDIVFDKRGTGISALDCVNKSLDAISGYNSIDFDKIGMIGHSHGGYITNFVATHSNRFATYIAGSGYSDIVRSYFSMSFHYMSPLYWQYENGQFNLKTSFWKIRNFISAIIQFIMWKMFQDPSCYGQEKRSEC
jgi:hypothetical protein